MISPVTGDVSFSDGLQFKPVEPLLAKYVRGSRSHEITVVPGWRRYFLGYHPSEHGSFDVETILDRHHRVKLVLMSHEHEFYERDTPDDAERHVFHEGVLNTDLLGQREFSWGVVSCRYDPRSLKDWIFVAYTLEAHVPLSHAELLRELHESEPEPRRK